MGAAASAASVVPSEGAATRAKTVKPPFWWSRFALLSPRLKKNSLVALSGLSPTFAIATVP